MTDLAIDRPRDLILVFGARVLKSGQPSPLLARRLEGAVAAGAGRERAVYLVMGGSGGDGPTEADAMRRALLLRNVDGASILRERASRDTLEQVRMTSWVHDRYGPFARVMVCTSPFHQPRCVLLLAILGIRAQQAAMPADLPAIGPRAWLYYATREMIAVAVDSVLLLSLVAVARGRLRPQLA